jgi:hypothetical protein
MERAGGGEGGGVASVKEAVARDVVESLLAGGGARLCGWVGGWAVGGWVGGWVGVS